MHPRWAPPIIILPLILTACSSATQEDQSAAELDHTSSNARAVLNEDTMDIELPLDKYTKTRAESALALAAREVQYRDCAQDQLNIDIKGNEPAEYKPEFNYGIWGNEFVSHNGYDTEAVAQSVDALYFLPPGVNTEEEHLKILECEYLVKEFGAFPYGYFEQGTIAEEVFYLSEEAWSQDPEVEEWRQEWKQCFEDQGYRIDDDMNPWSPVPPADMPQEEELRMALADVDCKEQTGAFQKMMDRRAQYQDVAIREHQSELDEYRRGLDAQMQEARDLLTEHDIRIPQA